VKVDTITLCFIQASAQYSSGDNNTCLIYSILPDQSIDLLKSLLVPAEEAMRSVVMPSRQNRTGSNTLPDLIQTSYVSRAEELQRCVNISRLIGRPEPDKLNAAGF